MLNNLSTIKRFDSKPLRDQAARTLPVVGKSNTSESEHLESFTV